MYENIPAWLVAIVMHPFFNAVSFGAGLLLGHFLSLGRDRRKEFNEAALPIREWLLKDMERPSAYLPRPSAIELDTFLQCLGWRKSRSFRRLLELEAQTRQHQMRTDGGGTRYADPAPIQAAKRRLLPLTTRR